MLKLSDHDIKQFETSYKIGLIATIDTENDPHITLIPSLQANTPTQLIFGQYIEGLSKQNVKSNNKMGFLIMSLKKELWMGKARWSHEAKEGPEYEMFNKKPLYRYNSYFGVHTVHYMDLIDITLKEQLNMKAIIINVLKVASKKNHYKNSYGQEIMNPWTQNLFRKINSLKFLTYIDTDGFPTITPIIQARTIDTGRIAFSNKPFYNRLNSLKQHSRIAVFGMNLDMENVLVKGNFSGFKGNVGYIEIDKVYNSMPPKQGYIYPTESMKVITEF